MQPITADDLFEEMYEDLDLFPPVFCMDENEAGEIDRHKKRVKEIAEGAFKIMNQDNRLDAAPEMVAFIEKAVKQLRNAGGDENTWFEKLATQGEAILQKIK